MAFAQQIGIDLGTANVLVYVKGKGIVLNEPSAVALSTKDGRVKAVGRSAYDMLGRTPETIEVIKPMSNGVIADYQVTEAMMRHFIGKARGRYFNITRPEVMISIPAGVTSVERRAVRRAALEAKARVVHLIREPLAAALGANLPIADSSGNMVIDIGGGTTEVAIISLYGIVVASSIRVGGNKLDEAITAYIKRKYNLMIG